jgi:hypothetical protein
MYLGSVGQTQPRIGTYPRYLRDHYSASFYYDTVFSTNFTRKNRTTVPRADL